MTPLNAIAKNKVKINSQITPPITTVHGEPADFVEYKSDIRLLK
jgi:hypothetical protein